MLGHPEQDRLPRCSFMRRLGAISSSNLEGNATGFFDFAWLRPE